MIAQTNVDIAKELILPRGATLIESLVYQSSSGAPGGRGCSLKLTHTNQCKFQLFKSKNFMRYIFTIVKLLLNNTSAMYLHSLDLYKFLIFWFLILLRALTCMVYCHVKRDKIQIKCQIQLVLFTKLLLSVAGVSFNNF